MDQTTSLYWNEDMLSRNIKIRTRLSKMASAFSGFIMTDVIEPKPGPRLNTNTIRLCMGWHDKDETVPGPSNLDNGNIYTGKTTSLYWDDPLGSISI